ncbi:hypothetical protein I4U23_009861 [Adineta vaga]|nr:hypothetical protein I4U23_009861 [Adineta vaga]
MNSINLLPMGVAQKLEESRIPRGSVIFYQNDRWVFQLGSTIHNDHLLYAQPFDTLGPFDIHSVDMSFEMFLPTSQYHILTIGGRKLNQEERAIGYCAPIARITLEGFARSTASIPEDATHFCWLYPPNNIHHSDNVDLDSSYEENLLKLGGFAYFKLNESNDTLELVRVNALIVSATNGLTFEGPYPWRAEFVEQLWNQNRFQPVTLSILREKGARYFAFINPYESFVNTNDQSIWEPSSHGAFVYLFNEDHSPHPFDCYFSVSDNCLGVAPCGE